MKSVCEAPSEGAPPLARPKGARSQNPAALSHAFTILAALGSQARRLRSLLRRCWLGARLLLAALRLPEAACEAAATLGTERLDDSLQRTLGRAAEEEEDAPKSEELVLAIDVGATRTKLLLCAMTVGGCSPGRVRRLPPVPTARLWQNPALESEDKFDPEGAPARVRDYLLTCGVVSSRLGRLVFAVPGTVDLATEDRSDYTVVKNTPSMSPRFRGFDFKLAFREVCPRAKVSAVPDGLAAALGVACENRQLRSALVLILGTAPAVATLFRDPSGKGRFVEVAIWQSWVWFTKIRLDDPHGYCGGPQRKRTGGRRSGPCPRHAPRRVA